MACRKDGKGRVLRKGENYRKTDGRYSYVYHDALGKKRTIYAKSLTTLRQKEETLVKDQLDGINFYIAGKADVNFLFDRYIATKSELRSTTYSNYTYMWNHFIRDTLGKRKIKDVKYSEILYFYNDLVTNQGMAINTLETINTILRPTFQLAVRDDIIRKNPVDGAYCEIKKRNGGSRKTRRALTVEQQRAFMDYVAKNRPLDEVYPILYIDAIHYSVRDNGVIRKLAAYVILGINTEGKKEVLTISVGDNESAKYWLSVMNELKNRGVKDVLIICADGLTGIKEAIAAAFPKTEYQRCIVHQVRNTLKYVPDKDRKAFAADLKTIYQAADEKKALAALDRVTEKWSPKYPNSMKRWKDNWDAISPIFKFSTTVRTVIYTTNAIESLNSTYRKLNRQRSVFPSDTALLKALYLATFEATKKWTSTIRNWAQVYGELSIMYEGRLPE